SFRRGVNLNTWLSKTQVGGRPLLALTTPQPGPGERDGLAFVDWGDTRAYAIGINSIYINEKGREPNGIVPHDQRKALMDAIAKKLLELRDTETDNGPVVAKTYIVEDEYPTADPKIAPDMLVGYARGYRGSWATTLGGYKNKVLENNMDRWSGDHCIAAFLVP